MLRELDTNEMEIVSGGHIDGGGPNIPGCEAWGEGDGHGVLTSGGAVNLTHNQFVQLVGGSGGHGPNYSGASWSVGVGASFASSGSSASDSGHASFGFGLGGVFTIGNSSNTDQAVLNFADNTQFCLGLCTMPSLNTTTGDWNITIGSGIFIPAPGGFLHGGKTPH